MKGKRDLARDLAFLIAADGLPAPEREYRFAAHHVGLGPGVRRRLAEAGLRDWRLDLAWPDLHLAVEADGGIWVGGRHVRGKGFEDDHRKINAAILLGWRVLRFTAGMIDGGEALPALKCALKQRRVVWKTREG